MLELYTSLTALKMQASNGGRRVPHVPLTKRALKIIDPAFTPGMGAIAGDPVKGLRCPVRGCGAWYHQLGAHLTVSHRDIGKVAILDALSIPPRTPLVSAAWREKNAELVTARGEHLRKLSKDNPARPWFKKGTRWTPKRRRRLSETKVSVMVQNIAYECEAQYSSRFLTIYQKLGRSPSMPEWEAEYGDAEHLKSVYGSWNNALTHFGLERRRKGCQLGSTRLVKPKLDPADLLASLSAWYERNGELPNSREVQLRIRAPRLHAYDTYLKGFKTDSWGECMRRAASLLNIYGGRYGLPESVRPKEAS